MPIFIFQYIIFQYISLAIPLLNCQLEEKRKKKIAMVSPWKDFWARLTAYDLTAHVVHWVHNWDIGAIWKFDVSCPFCRCPDRVGFQLKWYVGLRKAAELIEPICKKFDLRNFQQTTMLRDVRTQGLRYSMEINCLSSEMSSLICCHYNQSVSNIQSNWAYISELSTVWYIISACSISEDMSICVVCLDRPIFVVFLGNNNCDGSG